MMLILGLGFSFAMNPRLAVVFFVCAPVLAVALALYSGLCDKVIPEKLMVFGEVGLGGEVRAASHVRERVKEGARLGFERCIIPKQSFSSLSRSENYGIQIIGVRTLEQAFRAINADKEKENKE